MQNKVFRKENRYYCFYSGLPLLLWLELLCLYVLSDKDSGVELFFKCFGVIGIITSFILGVLYYRSVVSYRKQLDNLTEEQRYSLKV